MAQIRRAACDNRTSGLGAADMESVPNPTDPNAKSVLIVDDDAVFVRPLPMKLRSAGFKVRSAHGASEAIESLRDNTADARPYGH